MFLLICLFSVVNLCPYKFLEEDYDIDWTRFISEDSELFKPAYYILDELETSMGVSGYEVFLHEHFDLTLLAIIQKHDILYEKEVVIKMISKIIARRTVTSDVKGFVSEFVKLCMTVIDKVLNYLVSIVDHSLCIFENWESMDICFT